MAEPKYIASWSEIDTARQCPYKHRLSYVERWRSPRVGPALARGTSWHTAMEMWYDRSRGSLEERYQQVRSYFNQDKPEQERGEHDDLLWWMFDGYQRHYGDDPDWKILAIELPFQVALRYPKKDGTLGKRSPIHLKGKIDLLVLWNGRLWIVDHKTGRNLPQDKELALDDQFGLYTWALRELGRPVFGSLHNAVRTFKPKPDNRPENADGLKLNKDGSVSSNQPPGTLPEDRFKRTLLNRTDQELTTIAAEAFETLHGIYYRGNKERHPNSDTCKWRCDYLEVCLGGRKGGNERRLLEDYGFYVDLTRH